MTAPCRPSAAADHSPVTVFDPRDRLIGICLTVSVLAGFLVSLAFVGHA
jgi:hypothetical protein